MLYRFLILFIVGFAGLCLAPSLSHATDEMNPPPVSKKVVRTVTKAKEKAFTRNNSSALLVYERALDKSNLDEVDRSTLKKFQAELLMGMGRYDEAMDILDGVSFENHSRDRNLMSRYQFNLLLRDQIHHAYTLLQEQGAGLPKTDEVHYLQALRILASLGKMDDATALLPEFAEKFPNSALAQNAYKASLETIDRDAVILSRATPMMPAKSVRSGECRLSIGVLETGRVDDVKSVNCTEPVFEENSEKAVRKFLFFPKLIEGTAVPSTVDDIKIVYTLANEKGEVIPAMKRKLN